MNSRQPTHTPYDGSSKLFTIGLKPLELDKWIEVDGHLIDHLAEKRRLYAEIPDKVFVEEDGTRDAQREVRDLIEAHLLATFPQTYRRTAVGIEVIGAETNKANAFSDAPLVAASLLVQEDLILMRRDETGWRLAAGSLCFPSSWSLAEKFGHPLQQIHAPVPGFGPGTRPAELINRMFDGLQGQAVERFNWSIQADDALYHPLSNVERIDRATNRPSRFLDGDVNAHAFIRVERQTLRKLPVSRDILFTIRIHLDPLKVLARHPDRATLAASFAAQLQALDEAQLDYKGMTSDRDRLVQRLQAMARSDDDPTCLKQAVLLGALLALPATALADPVTYAGKLGNIDVVVEFTGDPGAAGDALAARYFYRSKGVDIPLQAKSRKGNAFQLAEEEACNAKKCGDGQAPSIGAVWKLSSSDKGKTLEGTWTARKTLPLKLTRIASRAQTETPAKTPRDLYDFSDMTFSGDDAPITMAASPYDYLKLDFAPKADAKAGWPDAAYDYVTDPRTKFARPRIVDLAGGTPIEAANALLQNRHWHDSLSALTCAALQYAGFHDGPPMEGMDGDSLGGYEDTTSKVTSLTPKLMSWSESGSLYCGGAHPNNYSDAYVMDVRRGALLGLHDMFSDTVDGKPGPSLAAFVKEKRKKPSDQTEIDYEAECGMDDLISDYLGASLKRDGDRQVLVFGLQGLPNVIQACGDDLVEMPVSEAKALFTPEFAKLLEP